MIMADPPWSWTSWGKDGFVYFHANMDDRFHIWRIRLRGALAEPAGAI